MNIFKNKTLIIGISLLFLLLASAFTFWSVFTPVEGLKIMNNGQSGKTEGATPCYDDPSLQGTMKEITYQEAFISMAQTDSIGLVVNLSDSLMQLSLKGVIIHSAKMKNISTDGFFGAMDICSYQNLFSAPIEITGQKATVEKEPIVVKKAPKSPEEADSTIVPYSLDTLKAQQIANIELTISAGFKIFIHDASAGCEKMSRSVATPGEIWKNVKRLIQFKGPEYQPAIHICVDKNDALSIYRALPKKAFMVMKV